MSRRGHDDGAAGQGSGWTRSRTLLAVAAAVVVALVGLGVWFAAAADGPDRTAASSSSSSAPSASEPAPTSASIATPTPPAAVTPVPAGAGDELPPSLPAVRLDQTAAVGDGVTASIVSLDAIDAEAHGPGNIGGPALRVGIRLVNGTGAAISLDGVSVNMTYGPDLTPASPVNDPSTSMFTGSLAPGDAAEAVTVFTVPRDSRDTVSVTVGYRPGAPLVVFTGTAP